MGFLFIFMFESSSWFQGLFIQELEIGRGRNILEMPLFSISGCGFW